MWFAARCADMVSKSADEGQASAHSDDVAVWSCCLRVPAQCRPRCYNLPPVPRRSDRTAAASRYILTSSHGDSVQLLQRQTAASRRRSSSSSCTALSDRSRHGSLLGGGVATGRLHDEHRPHAAGTCWRYVTAVQLLLVAHCQHHAADVVTPAESCRSRHLCVITVVTGASRRGAAVPAFQIRHWTSVNSPLNNATTIFLVLVGVIRTNQRQTHNAVLCKERFIIKLWCDTAHWLWQCAI